MALGDIQTLQILMVLVQSLVGKVLIVAMSVSLMEKRI